VTSTRWLLVVAGGGIADEGVFDTVDRMIDTSLRPSIIAGHVASHLLRVDGLLALTGAMAALSPTPAMLGYGVAKNAVHFLMRSLSVDSGLQHRRVIALLPEILDTPSNRCRSLSPSVPHASASASA
jgi:dihydropteridine reductase